MNSLGLGNSLLVTMIGMSIVFVGLVVLIALIKLLVAATDKIGGPKRDVRKVELPHRSEPVAVEAPPVGDAEDESQTVAAIMAALSIMLQEENQQSFVVRRIRRIDGQRGARW